MTAQIDADDDVLAHAQEFANRISNYRNPYSITIILRSYPQYNQAKAHFDDEIGTNLRGKWSRNYRENSEDRKQDSTINTDDSFMDGIFHKISEGVV